MASYVIYKKRSMDADISVSGLKYLKPPSLTFEAKADFDGKIFDQVAKDTVLLKEMNQAADAVYDQTTKGIRSKLSAFEDLIGKMVDKNATQAEIQKQVDGLNKSIEKDRDLAEGAAEKDIEEVWKGYLKKKKEYQGYKIKIGLSVVGSFASLGTSIGLMASSPFTAGVGAAAGIVSMTKSVVQIAREIGSACQEVETSLKLLAKQLDILENVVKTKVGRVTNEVAGAVFNQVLGIAEPTIKSCKSHLETVQSKLNGVEIKVHEAGKALNDLLDQQEKLRKEFMKEASSRLAKHPSAKAKDQVREIEANFDKFLAEPKKTFVKQMDKLDEIDKRFKKVKPDVVARRQQVDQLAGLRSAPERWLRLVLTFADLGGGVTIAATEGAAVAGEIVNAVVPWVALFAYDKVSEKVLDKTFLAD